MAWRAPRAPREGAKDGLQTRGPEWGCCRGPEKGWPWPKVARRGHGRGCGFTRGPLPSQDLSLPTRQWALPSIRPEPCSWGRPDGGRPRPRCPRASVCRPVKWGDSPERPRTAHPLPSTACRHRSWLREPLVPRWPSSSVPEDARSAGAGRPWQRRDRGWQPELDLRATHRSRRARAAFFRRESHRSAPGLVFASCLVPASRPTHRPMGGQGGQRRWGLPRLPRLIALWRAVAAAGAT